MQVGKRLFGMALQVIAMLAAMLLWSRYCAWSRVRLRC